MSDGFKKRILAEVKRMRRDLDSLEDQITRGDGRAKDEPVEPVKPAKSGGAADPPADDDNDNDDDGADDDDWP